MSRERVYVRKTSATKLLITIVIVIIAAGVLTKSFADSGLFYELLKALCKAIPFSGKCLEFCTKFAEKALGIRNIQVPKAEQVTAIGIANDIVKSIFAAVLFELMKTLCGVVFDADNKGSVGQRVKYLFTTMLASVLASVAAGIVMSAMSSLVPDPSKNITGGTSFWSAFWSWFLTILFGVGSAVAGYFLAKVIYKTGKALLASFVKYILMNWLTIMFNYLFLILILILLNANYFHPVLAASGAWVVLMFILIGISMALDTVLEPDKNTIYTRSFRH